MIELLKANAREENRPSVGAFAGLTSLLILRLIDCVYYTWSPDLRAIFKQTSKLTRILTFITQMTALGHKQTISPILAECLLLGVKRTFDDSKLNSRILIFITQIQTSAFPDSGRSDHYEINKMTGS